MIQYNNTPIAAAATVAYWIWKKKSTKFFSRDRIPHTFPDHEFLSPQYTYCTRRGETHAHARASIGTALRFRSSDYIYASSPPSVQIARRSLASRKKCVFISTVTISLFFLYHSLSLFPTLNTKYNVINIGREEENRRRLRKKWLAIYLFFTRYRLLYHIYAYKYI